jgi:hypothetical protein
MRAALAPSLIPALLLALCLTLSPPTANAAEDINAGDGSREPVLPSEKAAPAAEEVKKVAPPAKKASDTRKKAAAPPAEVPKGLDIKVREDRLSVNVKDTAFGDVMAVIANAAGFDVDLSNDVYEMKLSTKFRDTEIQRGIRRLILLINQKNYFVHYGKEGSIKYIEVYGDLASGKRTLPGSRLQGTLTPPPIVVPKVTIIKRAEEPVPEEPPELPEEPEEEEILELEFRQSTTSVTGVDTTPAEEAAPAEEAPPPPPGPSDIDDDGDGYTENQGDCNDSDSWIYSGAPEICEDGIDQDCDGADATCQICPNPTPPVICPEPPCIPSGDIPPDLLCAPYIPPTTPPLHVP